MTENKEPLKEALNAFRNMIHLQQWAPEWHSRFALIEGACRAQTAPSEGEVAGLFDSVEIACIEANRGMAALDEIHSAYRALLAKQGGMREALTLCLEAFYAESMTNLRAFTEKDLLDLCANKASAGHARMKYRAILAGRAALSASPQAATGLSGEEKRILGKVEFDHCSGGCGECRAGYPCDDQIQDSDATALAALVRRLLSGEGK